MKETFYFSHDYNARQDEKIKQLIRKHGMRGYGIFWALVEDLYNNANALRLDCEGIAFDLREDQKIIESIVKDFGLFIVSGKNISSDSIKRRLDERNEKSKKARETALLRWGKKETDANASNLDANALPTHSERNAIKERKVKEIKEYKKNIKELIITSVAFDFDAEIEKIEKFELDEFLKEEKLKFLQSEKKPKKSKRQPPPYDEFLLFALENKPDVNRETLKLKYESWKANDWQTGKDKPIKNWKSTILNTLPYLGTINKSEPMKGVEGAVEMFNSLKR